MVHYAILDVSLTDVHNPRLYKVCTSMPNYIDTRNILVKILVLEVYTIELAPSIARTSLPVQAHLRGPKFVCMGTLIIHQFTPEGCYSSSESWVGWSGSNSSGSAK